MKNLLIALSEELKFCCIYAFLRRTRRYRTGPLARVLGVDPRTVRRWRADFRCRRIGCANATNCKRRRIDELPFPLV